MHESVWSEEVSCCDIAAKGNITDAQEAYKLWKRLNAEAYAILNIAV
jgi:hypothetical protein